jgi:hypothetical protein
MLSYLDRTFCSTGEGCTCGPYRHLTPEVVAAAAEFGLGIAVAKFCHPEQGQQTLDKKKADNAEEV